VAMQQTNRGDNFNFFSKFWQWQGLYCQCVDQRKVGCVKGRITWDCLNYEQTPFLYGH